LRQRIFDAEEKLKRYEEIENKIRMNGFDPDVLATMKNSQIPDNPAFDNLQRKMAQLEEKLNASQQQLEDERDLTNIKDFIHRNSDDFEFIKEDKLEGEVQKMIKKVFQENGRILTYMEAAKIIEDHLEKSHEEYLAQISKSKKGKKVLSKLNIEDVKVPKKAGTVISAGTKKEIEEKVIKEEASIFDKAVKKYSKTNTRPTESPNNAHRTHVNKVNDRRSMINEVLLKYANKG
jgi:hypothetical protein